MTIAMGSMSATTNEMHDLVGVGFGPASLAIAVALHDALEDNHNHSWPRVKFLERQTEFGWQAGMLLSGARMQISFIKDLATVRNPRSYFTFLNYLKQHNRLIQFTNLDTFLPLRIEFEDYLKWCANHFQDMVQYRQDVLSVKPIRAVGGKKYAGLEVTSVDRETGVVSVVRAKNVVIAVGGRPSIPPVFPASEKIIHSSQYQPSIDTILPDADKEYTIAVIGGGQSAAEIFDNLHAKYPRAKTLLIMRDTAMRPSDDSPFVNEVFDPSAVDDFFSSDADSRRAQVEKNKATNYSVVRLGLLEKIYENLYHQRIKTPDPSMWQHQILASREVAEVIPEAGRLNLVLKRLSCQTTSAEQVVKVDAIILATGYIRDLHNKMLQDCQVINNSRDGSWIAGRGYGVQLNRNVVEDGVNIYLQGCNEQTHGLSDTLLSILATRGGELVQSIFGQRLDTGMQDSPTTKLPVHTNGDHHSHLNGTANGASNGAMNGMSNGKPNGTTFDEDLINRGTNNAKMEITSNGH